ELNAGQGAGGDQPDRTGHGRDLALRESALMNRSGPPRAGPSPKGADHEAQRLSGDPDGSWRIPVRVASQGEHRAYRTDRRRDRRAALAGVRVASRQLMHIGTSWKASGQMSV